MRTAVQVAVIVDDQPVLDLIALASSDIAEAGGAEELLLEIGAPERRITLVAPEG